MEDSSLDLQTDPFINKHHGNSNIIWTSQPVNALSGFSFVLLIASSNAIDGPDVRAEFEKAGINTHFIPFIRNCFLITRTPKISHILGSHDV
ncbi:hypothetical protein NC653_040637 [Populus alba x Populus x berolinensis]|uniref:Uncharacterized protein n=1 Tax=Populus alba x Populus x berolinensis TaxID=444605 RepID=A0AAD6PPV1_9ROSI|nr:hypothetical protein NC653_040637 [Populus alba x Populus x berolinensis]